MLSGVCRADVLLCLLVGLTTPSNHVLLDVNHNVVGDMSRRLDNMRIRYVERKEKSIIFGDGLTWKDGEADETVFRNELFQVARKQNNIYLMSVFI